MSRNLLIEHFTHTSLQYYEWIRQTGSAESYFYIYYELYIKVSVSHRQRRLRLEPATSTTRSTCWVCVSRPVWCHNNVRIHWYKYYFNILIFKYWTGICSSSCDLRMSLIITETKWSKVCGLHQLCDVNCLCCSVWGQLDGGDAKRRWVTGSDIMCVSRSPGRSLWRPSAASSLKRCWPGRTTAPLTDG